MPAISSAPPASGDSLSPELRQSLAAVTPPVQVAGEHHRWTVEEYHRLGEAGGFQYGDLGPHETRVELLNGVIVNKYAEGDTLDEVRLRWTRDMYERLVARGGFEGLRVELIRGHILDKVSPQGSPHSTAVALVQEALSEVFRDGAHVRVQLPIRGLHDSEPEPDLAVVAGTPRDYAREHPGSALLIVEISDSSLQHDRTAKLAVYAASGFPEYWVVNVRDACLEVHREPVGDTYRSRFILRDEESVSPLTRPSASIPVADLLP